MKAIPTMLQSPVRRLITAGNVVTTKSNMNMLTKTLLLLLFLLPLSALAQDDTLFTIDGIPVMKSEFERIYQKNNHVEGVENKSVEEYLELFINFKLKVLEAKRLGFDTVPSFVKELAGYREQLEKPYLQDRNVIDALVREAYYRTLNEVNASHIMVRVPENHSPADTLQAYQRILDLRKKVLAGESFEKLARELSDDPSAKTNEGRLGWFSAFTMVFAFENAAYHTAVGEVSMPVRSKYGYHLIKVNATRPALGEIKLAHIMTRADKNTSEEQIGKATEKIDQYYDMLKKGDSFTEVAKQYSEDAGTARNGGQMRWLRSGELPANIEEQVFLLKDSGSITAPLRSDYGWHIFQLQDKRSLPSFESMKSKLEERVLGDERGKIADNAMIAMVKKESGYLDYPENVDALASLMDSSVYLGSWEPQSAGDLIEPVFSIGGRDYTQMELAKFMSGRNYRTSESLQVIVQKKCAEFANNELIAWEKNRLEDKNPEFKSLMQEYHDGILLFNISDQMVWSKAVSDSLGLQNFYSQHQQNYTWQERADVSVYTLKDVSYLDLTRKLARKRATRGWTVSVITNLICNGDSIPCVVVTDGRYEKGDHRVTGPFTWKKGFLSVTEEDGTWKVLVVNDIIAPMSKQLDEIRGQATADYQNYLDQQWIAALRAKYPVIVNKEVLTHVQ